MEEEEELPGGGGIPSRAEWPRQGAALCPFAGLQSGIQMPLSWAASPWGWAGPSQPDFLPVPGCRRASSPPALLPDPWLWGPRLFLSKICPRLNKVGHLCPEVAWASAPLPCPPCRLCRNAPDTDSARGRLHLQGVRFPVCEFLLLALLFGLLQRQVRETPPLPPSPPPPVVPRGQPCLRVGCTSCPLPSWAWLGIFLPPSEGSPCL